ncbi:hypothetical protein HOA92_07515 [archaeon]|jgi:hypothetical protein|nr:hypothetical protein [archaeon]MBT6762862.1 hypothetical protein [archaeon]
MLVFGVDVPLVEIVFVLSIIAGLLLLEAIVVVMLLMKQMNKAKKVLELVENLSSSILSIKKAEIEELDHLKVGGGRLRPVLSSPVRAPVSSGTVNRSSVRSKTRTGVRSRPIPTKKQ